MVAKQHFLKQRKSVCYRDETLLLLEIPLFPLEIQLQLGKVRSSDLQ